MENDMNDHLITAVLNRDFQGLLSFVVREGDIFEIDAHEYKVNHRWGNSPGDILGAWARCDRKNIKPFLIYLEFSVHKKDTDHWRNNHWAYEEKRNFSKFEAWIDLLFLVNHL